MNIGFDLRTHHSESHNTSISMRFSKFAEYSTIICGTIKFTSTTDLLVTIIFNTLNSLINIKNWFQKPIARWVKLVQPSGKIKIQNFKEHMLNRSEVPWYQCRFCRLLTSRFEGMFTADELSFNFSFFSFASIFTYRGLLTKYRIDERYRINGIEIFGSSQIFLFIFVRKFHQE